MTIRIRPARKDEAGALTELSRRSKAYWGYDNAFLAACADELYIGPAALDDMNQTWRVATEADSIAGVYGLAPVNAETVELEALFVEPGAIGKGIGRRLVDDALQQAQAHGFQRMITNRTHQHDTTVPAGITAGLGFLQRVNGQIIDGLVASQHSNCLAQSVPVGVGFDAHGQFAA